MSRQDGFSFVKEIHEFVVEEANYKVTLKAGVNPFNNMGIKCFVERNGELIANNPRQEGFNWLAVILFTGIGFLLGMGLIWSFKP